MLTGDIQNYYMYLGTGPSLPLVLHIALVFSAGEFKNVFSAVLAHPLPELFQNRGRGLLFQGEERYFCLGRWQGLIILYVVFTEKIDGNIHLITARKATPKERSVYEDNY